MPVLMKIAGYLRLYAPSRCCRGRRRARVIPDAAPATTIRTRSRSAVGHPPHLAQSPLTYRFSPVTNTFSPGSDHRTPTNRTSIGPVRVKSLLNPGERPHPPHEPDLHCHMRPWCNDSSGQHDQEPHTPTPARGSLPEPPGPHHGPPKPHTTTYSSTRPLLDSVGNLDEPAGLLPIGWPAGTPLAMTRFPREFLS
jgi:hypothetical protein